MPRLMLFAVAEKIIRDKSDGALSMISVLTVLRPKISGKDLPLDPDAVGEIPWTAGLLWKKTADDEGKEYDSKLDILTPNGRVAGEVDAKIRTGKPYIIGHIEGESFPIGVEGEYILRAFIRESGTDVDWELVGQYPLEVRYDTTSDEN